MSNRLRATASDDYDEPPPVPSFPSSNQSRYDDQNAYRPPAQPAPAYNKSTRGDRHANGKEQYEMTERSRPDTHLVSTEAFFAEVEEVKDVIRRINDNISAIEEYHGASLVNISEEQMSQNTRRLEALSSETAKLNQEAKRRIQGIELSNAKLPPSTGDLPMRKTQHAALKKRFIETIQRYQDIERTYQQKYRQRVERQIRIVKPDATSDEIERTLDSDEASQIFAQSLMQANRSGQARAVLSEVQSRHDDIKKIEKTILELHQLFMDMQMLVEQQGETLKEIEMHAETTVVDLEQGNKEIAKAIVSAKSTRAKKWCCFVIFIIILIVAAILIWWFAFDHKGIN
ncbi:Plasma membrane t-SNARE, secretory vesicle fusion [Apophysomyces ossiformis]|uniref:Plasma membrane t-SNARE, secretory vesicle fusion n=1 Tax=Apophysomyces ossiformis TaxID=679940 RepID=A0A8H7EPY2_9FUNG|nr:Plasma membrane t-SNARE, secretory vesicle fusion [Apophysomyces ossiformis]